MHWTKTWTKDNIILPSLDIRMKQDNRQTALDILRIPEYRSFIIARFFYVMALRMVTTIVGWRIYEITHNAFAIGLIGLSEFLPAFCLALYAGHVIDKSDKRRLLLTTTCCYLVCVAGLITLSIGSIINSLGTICATMAFSVGPAKARITPVIKMIV